VTRHRVPGSTLDQCQLRAGAGLAGLVLTSVSNITQLMNLLVRMGTELEMNMNSVERVMEYADLPGEIDVTVPAVRCGFVSGLSNRKGQG